MANTINEFLQCERIAMKMYVIILTGITIKSKLVKASPFSTKKRSDETSVMNLPELVEISDFMERFATLSNSTVTKVLLNLTEIRAPFWM